MAPPRGTMDFFAAQAAARRRTFLLVVLFALALALTVALADVGVTLALSGSGRYASRGVSYLAVQEPAAADAFWARFGDPLLPVAGAVLAIVALGTAWYAIRLGRDGGDAVARMVGGRPVDRLTQEPGEKRAVNVLEEMAIAAAIPVPRLYVLDGEAGINAFAAGTSPERAVVAVTRGALDGLSRDELQGVFGHELSHILNDDVRLNQRLISLLGGLTALAAVGRVLLRATGNRRSGGRRGRGSAPLALAGLALLLAGAIGTLFARLIRLAVSRQREFLADAASVQFTRNPAGLAGALSKISASGSALVTPYAPEAAHIFFANGLSGFASGFLSTHPPLEERIRRIQASQAGPGPELRSPGSGPSPGPGPRPAPGPTSAIQAPPLAVLATSAVGRPAPQHLETAAAALAGFPPALAGAAREPFGARALALALLLDADPQLRSRQLAAVAADPPLGAELARLSPAVDAVPPGLRLALLALALPALDALSADQARALVRDLAAVADADGRLTLREWALQRLVRRRLAPRLGASAPAVRAHTLEQVEVEALELLSSLAWSGQRDPAAAQQALDAGVQAMGVRTRWRLLPRDRFTAARLDAVLARLDEASPALKSRLLAGAAACTLADGQVTVHEAELLRAVAASLGLPMPSLPGAEGSTSATAA